MRGRKPGCKDRRLGRTARAVENRRLGERGERRCGHCLTVQSLDCFAAHKGRMMNRDHLCGPCRTDYMRRWHVSPAGMETRARYRSSARYAAAQKRAHHRTPRTLAGRFALARGTAKRTGRTWTIDRELFAALTSRPCTYCGGPLPETGSGLDRLDNKRGYEPDNVVPCCTICNRVRNDVFTHEEMAQVIGPLIERVLLARVAKAVLCV